jgi:hypothetical protein
LHEVLLTGDLSAPDQVEDRFVPLPFHEINYPFRA